MSKDLLQGFGLHGTTVNAAEAIVREGFYPQKTFLTDVSAGIDEHAVRAAYYFANHKNAIRHTGCSNVAIIVVAFEVDLSEASEMDRSRFKQVRQYDRAFFDEATQRHETYATDGASFNALLVPDGRQLRVYGRHIVYAAFDSLNNLSFGERNTARPNEGAIGDFNARLPEHMELLEGLLGIDMSRQSSNHGAVVSR